MGIDCPLETLEVLCKIMSFLFLRTVNVYMLFYVMRDFWLYLYISLCIHYTISFIPSTLQSLYVCILNVVLSLVEILSICTVILKVQLFFIWIG